MEAMRESWTDDRLDDLNRRVEGGFKRVDERFRQVDQRFDKVDHRLDKLDARFEALQRQLFQASVLLIAGLLGIIATQL